MILVEIKNYREKIMKRRISMIVLAILCLVLSLCFISCNPDSSNNGGSSVVPGSESFPDSYEDDAVTEKTREEILNTEIPSLSVSKQLSGVFYSYSGYLFENDPLYQNVYIDDVYMLLNNGNFTMFLSEEDMIEVSKDDDFDRPSGDGKYYKYVNPRLERIEGRYELNSADNTIKLYRSGEVNAWVDTSYSINSDNENIELYFSSMWFRKLCDAKTLEPAEKATIVGTWGEIDDNDRDYYVYSREGWMQQYSSYDKDLSVLNGTFSLSNGILLQSSSTEGRAMLIVDGKYLIRDSYSSLLTKISSTAVELKDATENPLTNKNPSYRKPTVTSKDEGTYDVHLRGDSTDADGSYVRGYSFNYVDILQNGRAIFVDNDGEYVEGTYTKDSAGNFTFNIGDVVLNMSEKDGEAIDLEHKISDEHITKISSYDEIKGSWYFRESYNDTEGICEARLNDRESTMIAYIPKKTGNSYYGYYIQRQDPFRIENSNIVFTDDDGYKHYSAIFKCGSYLVMSGYLPFSK